MRTGRVTWGLMLIAGLIACKKGAENAVPSAADSNNPATRGSTEEEPAASPEPRPSSHEAPGPSAPAKREGASLSTSATPVAVAGAPTGTARPPEAPSSDPPLPVRSSEGFASSHPPTPRPPEGSVSPHPPTPRPPEAQGGALQQTARPAVPDPLLLLTAADVAEVAGPKTEFQRTVLPGFDAGQDRQSLYFEPRKGGSFGFAIQVFRESDGRAARQRWETAFATYPNSTEITPVAGSSFFAYWGEVMHVGFLQPHGNLVVVVSCGRKFCDSDALYALAKKVSSRIK